MLRAAKLTFIVSIILFLNVNYINIYGFQENFEYRLNTAYDVDVPYRIYIPSGYETEKLPVVLYLHSAGERGTDNEIQLSYALYYLFADEFIANNPAIVIAPQCPINRKWVDTDWALGDYSTDNIDETPYLRNVYEILVNVIEEYDADTNRIYITGLSMGGYGTWDMLVRYPDMFAAAMPISGAGDSSKADIIKDIPIWAFHCEGDSVVPVSGVKKIMEAFNQIESDNFQLTIYPYSQHDAWTQTYQNEDVLNWLFRQSKSDLTLSESAMSEIAPEQHGYSIDSIDDTTPKSDNNIYGLIFVITAIAGVCILMIATGIKIIRSR